MKTKFNFRFLAALLVGVLMSANVFAQDLPVTGTIIDDFGEPVLGANVVVKGTSIGATTDLDGNFSFNAPKGSTIVVSFIGYSAQEVIFDGSPINLTLKEDSELLEDVVVIGYGVAKKNDLTGAVTAIKADDKNKGMVTNAQDMLAGKVAGVNIVSSGGAPGAGSTIRVRGGSSLNASNDPLIVIDGLAMDNNGTPGMANALSMVNPADIESFSVLKDASATAIYGSRGSNGVIIITTKKGSATAQKPRVSYNGNVSVSMKKSLLDVMDGDEFRTWVKDTYGDAGVALLGNANTDWQDEIYRVAVSTDHNITIAGGLKNMPYRVSLGYTNENGILKTSGLQRYTASVNVSPSFFEKHLTLNVNLKGMYANTRYANTEAIGAAVLMDPTQPVTSSDAKYKNFGGYFQWTNPAAFNDSSYEYTNNSNATKNPVSLLEMTDDRAKSAVFQGNIEGTYKTHTLENLIWHANFGWNIAHSKQDTTQDPQGLNAFYYGNYGSKVQNTRNLSFNAYTQYMDDIDLADQHYDVMVGYEWQHIWSENDKGNYYGLYPQTNNDATKRGTRYNESNPDGIWYRTENYIVSFFGRANYSILGRYGLTATVRYDGASRFKDHWALFPAFAFSWNAKEEAFLKDVDILNEAKLRLSYGKTGQQEINAGDYPYFASFANSIGQSGDGHWYPVKGSGELQRPNAYNENLTWETTTTYNVGADLGFLNNRFTLNGDVYYRKTTDLINTVYVSAGSNFKNKVVSNIGSLENKGFEVMATIRPIQKKDFQWEFSLNAAYNQNEVTALVGGNDEDYFVATGDISAGTGNMCQAHAVGHPASSFYVYQQVYDEKGMPIEGLYVDRNGDGEITTADKYFYKQPMAPWTFGLTNKFNYKNWDLGMNFRLSLNNYVFNDTQAGNAYCGKATVASYNHLENRPASARKLNFQSYNNALSDYFVQNGSFLKCDNITLGYSFPNLFGAKVPGRVYCAASNVFTITKYDGVDPEVDGGIDNNLYPRPFNILVGLSLNF